MTQDEQMGFDFGEQDLEVADEKQLAKAFHGFHTKHPMVWRLFRIETLRAVEERRVPIRAHAVMGIVRRKSAIPVDFKLIPLYRDLFTSIHQELAWVFKD